MHQRLWYLVERTPDLFCGNHPSVVPVQKTQIEWQAWKKVPSAALFIELYKFVALSEDMCTSYSEVNGDAELQ